MGANTDSYYLRRKSGSPVGPFSPHVLTTMPQNGTLDGSEDVSRDRRNWISVREVPAPAPPAAPTPPAPPAPLARPAAQSSGGMAALELADADLIPLELAPLQAAEPKPAPVKPALTTAEPKPTTMPRLSLGSMAAVREPAAPVVMLLAESEGRHFDATEPLGSVPLLPTIQTEEPEPLAGLRDP